MPSHFWQRISEAQLARMVAAGGYIGANSALDRARLLKKAGHHPAIFHNKLDGFMVLDADDPAQQRRIAEFLRPPRPAPRR